MFETSKEMFSLMCEMAEEGVERARIKSQQNRILEVVRIDIQQRPFSDLLTPLSQLPL